MKKILIIGSGISGLSCAYYLQKNNYLVELFEKNTSAGGRVSSEYENNFIFDVGFQVLLNNYNELRKINLYDELDIKYFNSGAFIFNKGKLLNVYSPIYHPIKFLLSNYREIFKFKDIYKLISLFFIKHSKSNFSNTRDFVNNMFSKTSLNLFFYPFFRGVFLSKNLDTSLSFFLKIIKKFTFGRVGLPSNGMAEISKKIIKLGNLKVNYEFELNRISENKAYFKNGSIIEFDKIVFAMPLAEINQIINIDLALQYHGNFTCYIKSEINKLGKTMLLVSEEDFEINSIQCLSNISKKYLKSEESLYSISSLNVNVDIDKIKSEFSTIMEINQDDFSIIKVYRIESALPKNKENIKNIDNIYFCGDWNIEPSIDGAMKSGRLTATKIIN